MNFDVLKKIFELIALLPEEMRKETLELFIAKWNKIIADNQKNGSNTYENNATH